MPCHSWTVEPAKTIYTEHGLDDNHSARHCLLNKSLDSHYWRLTSSGRLEPPSRAAAQRREDSWRTDSHANDSTSCVPSDTTRRRDCDSGHTSGSSAASSVSPPPCLRRDQRRPDRRCRAHRVRSVSIRRPCRSVT